VQLNNLRSRLLAFESAALAAHHAERRARKQKARAVSPSQSSPPMDRTVACANFLRSSPPGIGAPISSCVVKEKKEEKSLKPTRLKGSTERVPAPLLLAASIPFT
jgi:hypothetical protein